MTPFAVKVKGYHDAGRWSARMVRDAEAKGRIGAYERAAILGGAQAVRAELGSRPSKADLLAALDALGIEPPEGATNPELAALLGA